MTTSGPAPPGPGGRERSSAPTCLDILLEDNHCLAVNKPAGLLAQGDETGETSLVDLAREYLRVKYAKPGNVFVGLVHRLDRPTSGVTVLARTSKGADRLSAQFRDGTVRKVYRAVVDGLLDDEAGVWEDSLQKDAATNVVRVVPAGVPGGQAARVEFRVLERGPWRTSIELRPSTGRSHQLRVQLASRGLPIVGDRKYGASSTLIAEDGLPRIALHAIRLEFAHPTTRLPIALSAPLPKTWPRP